MKKNALWLLCVLVLTAIACGRKEDDLLTGLPSQPPVNFKHYAGYVNLGPEQKQKALFYWFFEAQQNSSRRPLVLWLNGGAGCSSIAFGAAQELGPFLVHTKGGNLTFNNFSWNKEANMLFLEAPVGVGFSYSNNSMDLQTLGDQVSAEDSLVFLINWFKKFPEFGSNEFYISGESYAGTKRLQETLASISRASWYALCSNKIGNAVIDDATDTAGIVDYAWSHAIISDELHNLIHSSCRFGKKLSQNETAQCVKSFLGFATAYVEINIYSIYTPICLSLSSSNNPKRDVSHSLLTSQIWDRLPSGYDPCTEGYMKNYSIEKMCSAVIKWGEAPTTVILIIQKLLKGGLRIWIYSGDTDGRVPVTSTRYSMKKMGLKVESPWRSWFHKSQVAGWVETYAGGLTFATVRGAGHQVPLFAPSQSLSLFSHFLSSLPLPSSRF